MQVLFLWDTAGADDRALAEQVATGAGLVDEERSGGLRMAEDAWAAREVSDEWIAKLAPQWPPKRQPGVDRAILRLGVWELTFTQTPPKVVIDEAIELAKNFSTEQSPGFINGVLDAVHKETQELIATKRRSDGAAEGTANA